MGPAEGMSRSTSRVSAQCQLIGAPHSKYGKQALSKGVNQIVNILFTQQEIRCQDYQQGRKAASASAFGQQTSAFGMAPSTSTSAFGQQPASTGGFGGFGQTQQQNTFNHDGVLSNQCKVLLMIKSNYFY